MPYTDLAEIERQKALAQTLRQGTRNRYDPTGMSGVAQVLNAAQAGYLDKTAADQSAANTALRGQEMDALLAAMTGEVRPPLLPGETPSFQHPEVQNLAMSQALQRAAPQELIEVSPAASVWDPNTGQNLFTAPPNPTSATSINLNSAGNEYLEGRGGSQAEQMASLEQAAESAFRNMGALNQFVQASATGLEGGAAPLLTAAQNFLSTFGFDFENLQSTAEMEQAVASILGSQMRELGARGLTDADMRILQRSLPRIETSREAREAVAQVLYKNYQGTIQEYINRANWESASFPTQQFYRPQWFEGYTPQPLTSTYEQELQALMNDPTEPVSREEAVRILDLEQMLGR